MKRLFLTGGSGFVGRYVRDAAATHGIEVVGADTHVELRDPAALLRALHEVQLDYVVHLAAQTFVPESFRAPRETFATNFEGTLNLLEALRAAEFRGRFLYVSSGDVYGAVPEDALPVTESRCPAPRNPYAVSKIAAEALCYQWSQTEAFEIVIARPFNHIGAGQDERFAVAGFAKQLASVTLGARRVPVEAGDVDVTRDITDVRDVVDAYFALLQRGRNGETYNVASDREVSLRDIIGRLGALAGVEPVVSQDASRLRRSEQRRMRASYRKLAEHTGWGPRVDLNESLRTILADWQRKLKS